MSLNLDDTGAGKPLGPAAAAISSLLPISVSRRKDPGIQGAGAQQSGGLEQKPLRWSSGSRWLLLVFCWLNA